MRDIEVCAYYDCLITLDNIIGNGWFDQINGGDKFPYSPWWKQGSENHFESPQVMQTTNWNVEEFFADHERIFL
jgi:hypothetical protein